MFKLKTQIKLSCLLMLVLLLLACKAEEAEILGQWEKPAAMTMIDGSASIGCDLLYSSTLEFFDDGTYAGNPASLWRGGEYEIVESGRVKLATMQGGFSVYSYTLNGETLTFREGTCEFTYQRVK